MSQIGYMFVGAGVGAYANGIFHLMTHAFFKALLFLAAGIVIHALLGEQDMRKMGGLRRLMPRTYVALLVGALALAGMPPLSGFFSKDAILASSLAAGGFGYVLFAAGIAGAFLTGLYTFRMVFLVFWGEPSPYVREHHHAHHGQEGPFSMTSTVAVLAVLAVVGGWIQIAGIWHPLADFLHVSAEPLLEPTVTEDWITSLIAVAAGAAGIALAWLVYAERRVAVPRVVPVRRALEEKLYFDEAYDDLFYEPASETGRGLGRYIEGPLIGGSISGLTRGFRNLGLGTGRVQTGYLRSYALAILGGVAVLALVFISVR
jgi:NADH-quinone oxidoreductase subunit L